MTAHFDALETRTDDERQASLADDLPRQIARAKGLSGYGETLAECEPDKVTSAKALAALPVLRKTDLQALQAAHPPLGGLTTIPPAEFDHLFQSPGPIYEPGRRTRDWWRFGRALAAAGIGTGDIVQNCFGYHLTPAGQMFENAAEAVGAAVISRRHRPDRATGRGGRASGGNGLCRDAGLSESDP